MDTLDEYKKYIMPVYSPQPITFDHGEGCYLFDHKGKKYLDLFSGVAVNALGHNHPALVNAISGQCRRFIHLSNLFIIKEQVALARELCHKFGGGKAFFCNSGAEAIEGAIKLARKYGKKNLGPEKHEIISMKNSFHGRTLAAITATGQPKYQKDLDPLPAGFCYADFGNLASIKEKINQHTCAILIEPVQGEGGINLASQEFWDGLGTLCKENNLLLILDEIQTGVGRTGKFYAHEHYQLTPDIICLAKGLGGGMPIGAILARESVAASFTPGDHASTFGGNPLACSAALAVLNTIRKENLLEHVTNLSKLIEQCTKDYPRKFSSVTEVRGIGLLWGIDLEGNIDSARIIQNATDKGLLLNCIGGHIIRIAPPLVITEDELNEGLGIIENVLKELA